MTRLCQYTYVASQGRLLGWPILFVRCSSNLGVLAAQNDYFVKGIKIESINHQSWRGVHTHYTDNCGGDDYHHPGYGHPRLFQLFDQSEPRRVLIRSFTGENLNIICLPGKPNHKQSFQSGARP